MPEGPLDFWESLTLNEIIAWACVIIGGFVVLLHLLERAEEMAKRRRLRKSRG